MDDYRRVLPDAIEFVPYRDKREFLLQSILRFGMRILGNRQMRRFLPGTLQGTAKLILLGCASLVGLNSLAFSLTVAPTLLPVHEGDKGGYIDRTGRVVI